MNKNPNMLLAWETLSELKRPTRDLYSVLRPCTWLYHVSGVFPLRLRGPVGGRKYVTSYAAIIYCMAILLLTTIGLFAWSDHTNERLQRMSSQEVITISIQFQLALEILSVFVMVLSAILNRDKFANAIDSINMQDTMLRKLGCKLDYAADLKQKAIKFGIIISIISILCIYDFTYQINFNLRYPLNWFTWMAPNITRISSTLLFTDVVLLLRQRFAALNEQLKKMIEESRESAPETITTRYRVCSRIQSIAFVHGALCEAAINVNATFGLNIVIGVVYAMITLTCTLFYVIRELEDVNCSYFRLFGNLDWAIISSLHIIYLVIACNITRNQAGITGKLIHKFKIHRIDTHVTNTIQSFSLQLHHEKIKFTGAGLFPLDTTLLQSILGAVTTYLIILIQFEATIPAATTPTSYSENHSLR